MWGKRWGLTWAGAGGDVNGGGDTGGGTPSGNWICVRGALKRGAEPSHDMGVVEARRGGVVGRGRG